MLIVIDMQRKFPAAEHVLGEVIKHIQRARRRSEWILVLEYEGIGHTMRRITDELKGYDKVIRKLKWRDDGSPFVLDALMLGWRSDWGLSHLTRRIPRTFKVCGVNTGACVYATVLGLNQMDAKITVLSKACAHYCNIEKRLKPSVHRESLRHMKRLKHVKVV